jgi:hypothetical protein
MPSFLPFLAILVLLAFAGLIPLIHRLRRELGFSWLTAAAGALAAWPLVLLSRLDAPYTYTLPVWQAGGLLSSAPTLLVDEISWPYALAVATLSLAVILTDAVRTHEANWYTWIGVLVIAALGLAAVLAGNPFTLLLCWAALDVAEYLLLLRHLPRSPDRERLTAVFSARVIGMFLLIAAMARTRYEGAALSFGAFPPDVGVYLLLAGGLRLGVIPLHLPFLQEMPLRRNMGTVTRLVTAAASLMLVNRAAAVGLPEAQTSSFLALLGLAAAFGGFSWLSAANDLDGRPFWILGIAGLSLAAAARGQVHASLAWGLGMIFSGGLLFLLSAQRRRLLPLAALSLLACAGLPFTPSGAAMALYSPPLNGWLLLFLLSHAALLAGFLRHALRPAESPEGQEAWVWVVYLGGLLLLPLAHFLAAWWLGPSPLENFTGLPWLVWLAAALTYGFAVAFAVWLRRGRRIPTFIRTGLHWVFSWQWVYPLLWQGYRAGDRISALISTALEGEGGLLWTLLIMVLMLTFVLQGGLGGAP